MTGTKPMSCKLCQFSLVVNALILNSNSIELSVKGSGVGLPRKIDDLLALAIQKKSCYNSKKKFQEGIDRRFKGLHSIFQNVSKIIIDFIFVICLF